MLRAVWPVLLALAVSHAACTRSRDDAALIRIDSVRQAFERPAELIVVGDGFPQGMRGEARLRGAHYVAGQAVQAVDLRAPCRALGSRSARVDLEGLAATLVGDGPFEGQLELTFGTRGDAQLVGRLERALVRIGSLPPIERQFALGQAAQRFQRALGIALLVESEQGLRALEIERDSPATRAGLSAHDLLLRMDGRPIQLARDVYAAHAGETVLLEVRRGNEQSARVLRVGSAAPQAGQELLLFVLALLLGFGAGVVLLHAVPSHLLWAPRRREYWLLSCCGLCAVSIGALIVQNVDPLLARVCEALALGALAAACFVYLHRRLAPTLRTSKDPELAPLL